MTAPPSHIGPYAIERELGRGGMGIVYLARDTRLDRPVAIKALPDHLATDTPRLARFEREARVLAQLNHPNVAAIYGLEQQDGRSYLVLEFVEGETLEERLDRGPIGIDDALEIAVQIARGAEAAHAEGITHRDLKPANIKIAPDGRVKVLDFGLARSEAGTSTGTASGFSESPTLVSPAHSPTIPGAILGTAPYMSPEQARGRSVDKRTDIWSYGAILYEMLTGIGPFAGETASDSIGAILHRDVDLDRLPAETPAMVRHVLRRCLERDREKRIRDVGDVRIELEHARTEPTSVEIASPRRPGAGRGVNLGAVVGIAGLVGLAGLAAGWVLRPVPPPPPRDVIDASIELPPGERLGHTYHTAMALSPDGETLVAAVGPTPEEVDDRSFIVGPDRLVRRRLDSAVVAPVVGTERGSQPAISSDGTQIAFVVDDGALLGGCDVRVIPLAGGEPLTIATLDRRVIGLAWAGRRQIILGGFAGQGLSVVDATGGPVTDLTTLDEGRNEVAHRLPHVLPGGHAVLFVVERFGFGSSAPESRAVWVIDRRTGERHELIQGAGHPSFSNGHLVFMREGTLMAAPFDPDSLRTEGPARPVLDGVAHAQFMRNSAWETGAAQYALAQDGTLVVAPGSVFPQITNVVRRVTRDGEASEVGLDPRGHVMMRIAPDGRHLLTSVAYEPESALWVHDLVRGISRPVAQEGRIVWAVWNGPDRVIYQSSLDSGEVVMREIRLGESGPPRDIPSPEELSVIPAEVMPDGRLLAVAFVEGRPSIRALDLDDGTAAELAAVGLWPTVSPDGRWLAYCSNETGQMEVFVQPVDGGPSVQVSTSGGGSPLWSPDGRQLFYRDRFRRLTGESDGAERRVIMAVPVEVVDGRLEPGTPTELFEDAYGGTTPIRSWDIDEDGVFYLRGQESSEELRRVMEVFHPDRLRLIRRWGQRLGGREDRPPPR